MDKLILRLQQNEITEGEVYKRLAQISKGSNQKVFEQIAAEEFSHYQFWKKQTGKDVPINKFRFNLYYFIIRVFGLTFGSKLMEKGEGQAQKVYAKLITKYPEAKKILEDEDEHEKKLINMIDEEKLLYIGSVVLGLNDALVELTGALAGFTLALQNRNLVAMAGLITGLAASLSMAASEYLSNVSGEGEIDAKKSATYTGIAYIFTVIYLIFPFFLFTNIFVCLGVSLFNAVTIIFLFTFYISVAKDYDFKKRFLQMVSISLGVATLSFGLGFLIRKFLHIDI
ncbi:rubrerythrin family protein [candidate division CPR3 bacterium GWF2_35_18]|uniref:Rubrerythrin diiron-binding domain-containing protein n=1 Tax=candidate division CPR3 bacterium GW2011_GWF2_35_18 TaxID=1618350 RepID=A0A0G0BJ57_UNCC3|nr:MAG: hypothetical protein UR67_C0005G0013 [candidate division CPR3 bacterium GW2011_GWF2_35_18]KKR24138.1 MAG: hypothetical protein UT55_C0071G0003 [Candidatus Peregrinibacteria bacterium GW2011_GWE2_39_6]OGB62993.1 MAG: rubrerythrin family protein [candidate division CPR3 bacterium GWF2_35_18]OGB63983.1 MAG: rubrerythrin family protein [candidate division CPR3 bacterium RIFOXYA2_FULL_35_13]OGB76326.1 MAG: rubrerythrin family protein [candidate division CPR3 bacterium RIFOXYC2_FULL_35_7]OGB